MNALPEPTDEEFRSMIQDLHDDLTRASATVDEQSSSSPAPEPNRVPVVKPGIQSISHVHEAIMNWMIENPTRSMKDCAAHFGYTQSWLSTMVHSNLFQARLKEKQDAIFSTITGSISEKLEAGAHIVLDKLIEHAEKTEDPKFLKETGQMFLEKLGFGAKTGGTPANNVNAQNVQQNFYVASTADLELARRNIAGGAAPSQAVALPSATPDTLPPPAAQGDAA